MCDERMVVSLTLLTHQRFGFVHVAGRSGTLVASSEVIGRDGGPADRFRVDAVAGHQVL